MFCLNYHPFNEKNMYVNLCKSESYNNWLKNFPVKEATIYIDSLNIDWDKPIGIYLKYVCKAEVGVGVQNFNKATIDMLLNLTREKGSGSVEQVIAEIVGECTDYTGGKIYFYIKNINNF